jgi:DUF1680 family protein
MERYFYHEANGTVYVDQFGESEYISGESRITQKTSYPIDGKIELEFENVECAAVRIPEWCDSFTVSVPYEIKDGYAVIESPSSVAVEFSIESTLYVAHHEVMDDAGRVALMRGPVVYCAERIDNNNVNLHRLCVNEDQLDPQLEYDETSMLYNITVRGFIEEKPSALYSRADKQEFIPERIKLIPFCTFANRGPSDMLVWLRSE